MFSSQSGKSIDCRPLRRTKKETPGGPGVEVEGRWDGGLKGAFDRRSNAGSFRDDVAGDFADATRRETLLGPPRRTDRGRVDCGARFPKPLVGGSSPPGTAIEIR